MQILLGGFRPPGNFLSCDPSHRLTANGFPTRLKTRRGDRVRFGNVLISRTGALAQVSEIDHLYQLTQGPYAALKAHMLECMVYQLRERGTT